MAPPGTGATGTVGVRLIPGGRAGGTGVTSASDAPGAAHRRHRVRVGAGRGVRPLVGRPHRGGAVDHVDGHGTTGGGVGAGKFGLVGVDRTGECGDGRQHERRAVVGGGGRVDDIGDDDGDVVRATAAQGQVDELGCGLVGRAGGQDLADGIRADRVGQAVGAEHEAVAGMDLEQLEGRFDGASGECLEDQ